MPELPEVETTKLGISPHITDQQITEIIIKRKDLRWPVSDDLPELTGRKVTHIHRRSKYLIFNTDSDQSFLVHLGMSGSLRLVKPGDEWRKHDHIALVFENGKELRFHDPRRFGAFLTFPADQLLTHPLLKHLGPEPLENDFTAAYLHSAVRNRSIPIKTAIMDAKLVVGVGNIYASESLFRSNIHPLLKAEKLTGPKAERLVKSIKEVLQESITQGGTTLRDFVNSSGEPGYFQQRLFVYGRSGEKCRVCEDPILSQVIGQRSTFWCQTCQKR